MAPKQSAASKTPQQQPVALKASLNAPTLTAPHVASSNIQSSKGRISLQPN